MDCKNIEINVSRELKEETGYTMDKITKVGKLIFYNDPWKSTECGKMVHVEIDGDAEIN